MANYTGYIYSITNEINGKASEITSIGRRAINNCSCGRSSSAGNYLWKYKTIGGV